VSHLSIVQPKSESEASEDEIESHDDASSHPMKRLWNTEVQTVTRNDSSEEDSIVMPLVNLASSNSSSPRS
jgi:hypothetical protein